MHEKGIRMIWEESPGPESSATSSNSDKYFCGTLADLIIIGTVPVSEDSSPVLGDSSETLRSVSIRDGVEEIGDKSFYKSATLSHVSFGESPLLKRIGFAAFSGCPLEYIHIPDHVEDIDSLCFYNCDCLSHVTFGEASSLKRIGFRAFLRCRLEQIHLPKSLERLDENCFCRYLSRVTFEEPSSLKCIGTRAFEGCAMREIQFPDSIEEISNNSFSDCTNLVRATFGESSLLKRIGDDAFSGCSSLCEISIPDSVEEIGSWCFSECHQFSCIKFGEHSSLKSIGGGCFSGSRVVEFSLPKSVISIGGVSCEKMSPDCGYTFRRKGGLMLADKERICYSLDFATIFFLPDRVEYLCDNFISRSAFMLVYWTEFSSLKRIGVGTLFGAWEVSVRIPEKVEELGDTCFCLWIGLRTVTFGQPATVQRIGCFAFSQCQELEEIEIPQTVRTIDAGCFYLCNKLRRVKFCASSVLEVIGRVAFFGCHLEEVSIPDSVRDIGNECFYMCLSLSTVTFGESPSLKRIGTRAFSGCPLRSISIPDSVEEICDECFYKCKDLTCVSFGKSSSLTSVGANAFSQFSMVKLPDGITVKAPTRQIVRIAVVGTRGSGKMSMIMAYTGHKMIEGEHPFVELGDAYLVSSVQETFNEETYELQITVIPARVVRDANQVGTYCFMTEHAFDVFICVDSARDYLFWRDCHPSVKSFFSRFPDGQRLLVGSMVDCVDKSQRPCMKQNFHIPYIECSAETGENIREVFLKALELYLKFSPEPRRRCEVS